MALSRSFLAAMGIESEKVDEIIKAHAETVEALKTERDTAKQEAETAKKSIERYKADAEKVTGLQEKVKELQAEVDNKEPDPFKEKFETLTKEKEDLQAQFDKYKSDIEAKETTARKRDAYRSLLKESGVSDKRLDSVMKVADFNSLEFNQDGSVKGAEKLKESIKTEWADFIEKQGVQGAATPTPPENNGGTAKTIDEIMAIKDATERQAAIQENHEAFGF